MSVGLIEIHSALQPSRGDGDLSLTQMARRANIYFNIISPTPGTFLIALHFKGRDKPILEMDLKIDDLLEKVCRLDYHLNIPQNRQA